ncbi:Glycosyltransferase, GT2 family [Desulfocicer vacuolatum DSM 3385]|uniref:Glycosyltransferase, GT2 family n=1 Tax=Desulfocicer vacuolatum DSM 3385 TaxID=1121400 RepID=A0A1W2BJD0_9BACT|nr:glycosyltransferase family 2 protein [Desulfocicer vacuolatum]SMC72983.1 Glycosyltransferase, GT2 family [Desulfocicer vacuolatum DSM 3385]
MESNTCFSPVCSICIANYNGIGYLDACLKSILSQNCLFPFEIIIHDDASTDNSVTFIQENYPDIQLIQSKDNVGFCISNNRMVERAKGEFVLLLNNDTELFPDALKMLHKEAQKEPAILGPAQYNAATGQRIDIGNLFDPFLNTVPNNDTARRHVGMVSGGCLWIPRKMWHELGGFPEWFHTLGEDVYLCFMANLRGYPVKALKETGFYHWVGSNIGGGKVVDKRLETSIWRRAYSERNRSYVMVMGYPFPLFQIIFPLHVICLFSEGLMVSAIKNDKSIFTKIYFFTIHNLFKNKKKLLKRRVKINKDETVSVSRIFRNFKVLPYKLYALLNFGFPNLIGTHVQHHND